MSLFADFDAIKVGDARTLVREIGEADVRRFVEMTGDDNPLHVDRAFAEATSFRDVVVHGMLGASFISTVIGTQLPGPGALWVSQSLEFLGPVRLGDTLTVSCVVTGKHLRERLLELDTSIVNQAGQKVLAGSGKVKVLEGRAAAAAPEPARRRVALVTGGGGGIGRAICERLARDGMDVAVAYRGRADRAEAVVEAIRALDGPARAVAIQADLAGADAAERLARRAAQALGPIDVLVNNASPAIGAKPFADLDWADIQAQLDVQVKAAFLLAEGLPARHAGAWVGADRQHHLAGRRGRADADLDRLRDGQGGAGGDVARAGRRGRAGRRHRQLRRAGHDRDRADRRHPREGAADRCAADADASDSQRRPTSPRP